MHTTTPKATRQSPQTTAAAGRKTSRKPPVHDTSTEAEQAMARKIRDAVFTPEMTAAFSMERIMDKRLSGDAGITPEMMAEKLQSEADAMEAGDLGHVRRTLAAQAAMLDQMFHHLIALATRGQNSADLVERFMRLAMRAQTQSALTLRALARMCGEGPAPRAVPTEPAPAQEAKPCSCHEDQRGAAPVAQARVEDSTDGPTTFVVTLPVASGRRDGPPNGSRTGTEPLTAPGATVLVKRNAL